MLYDRLLCDADGCVCVGPCRVLSACEKVSLCGEQVVLCLEQQIWQHNRAAEMAQEVTGEGGP